MTSGAESSESPSDGSARILIVEDELLIATECEFILTDAAYEVVGIAADEPKALSLAARERPDLVLMDIRLARGGDGVELARIIWERWSIRSIFTSAHGDQQTRFRGAAAHPIGWVVKPYTAETLLKAINQALPQLVCGTGGDEEAIPSEAAARTVRSGQFRIR